MSHTGKDKWKNMTEFDQQELHEQLLVKERVLRKNNTMTPKDVTPLHPGTKQMHDGTLQGIMGLLGDNHDKMKKTMRERRMTLRGLGKETAEVEATLKSEFIKENEGEIA